MKNFVRTATDKFSVFFYCLLITLSISLSGYAQNVGINSTGAAPNASAGLDVDFPDKGMLIPRVALTGTANFAPLSAHIAGMIVYNTATTGDVVPGFYYNNGSKWIPGYPTGVSIGDMLYWNGSVWTRIPVGATGQYLQLNGSNVPFWANASGTATLTTATASAITGTTATSGCIALNDGGYPVLSRGVCWKTTSGPTIADTKTVDGAGNVVPFASSLTGLLPVTTYYVRAYAMNSLAINYGNEVSFTTLPVIPTLAATTAASVVTGTTATSGGNVTATGGANISERGICYGTTLNPTTANTKIIDPTPGLGIFVSNLTGLTGYTTYHVRSYATNSAGTAYGADISFTTLKMPSVLVTVAASAITGTSATAGGSATQGGGGYSYGDRGIAYSTTPNSPSPTLVTSGFLTTFPTGPWVTNLTGLMANTTYYIRAYLNKYDPTAVWGTPAWSTDFGNELSFSTSGSTAPIVGATTAISAISDRAASSGGTITSDGGAAISVKGVCWGTTANPVLGTGNFTTDGTGSAAYLSNITGLTGSTTYHVRAYATNSVGTSYGTDVSFTTWVGAPYALFQNVGYGWVAYVAADGSGFIVSYDIPSTVGFGCSGTTFAGSALLGSGMANTNTILANCATRPIAASVAASYGGGGYVDWYLPSSGDFAVMAPNYNRLGFNYGYNNYYTSTPYSSNTYASTYWETGAQITPSGANRVPGPSDYIYMLRAARSFMSVEVTTAPLTNFTSTGAISGGTLLTNGGPAVTVKGVCWGTTSGPTVALATKTNNGTGSASFVSNITGLTSGIKYYVRAYATTSAGTAYGNEESFTATAATLATVSTDPITNLTATTATSGGNVTADGNSTVTASGVCWSSTSTTPTMPNPNSTIDGSGIAAFISSVTGLVPGTTYHLRAYATNGVGTAYGAVETFTPSNLAVVTTDPILSTGLVGAIAEGNYTVVSEGAGGITAAGLCWGTSSNPTITTHVGMLADPYYLSGSSFGISWALDMTGLTINTVYHVRAFATNGSGTAYGADVTFTATAATLGQLVNLNYQSGYVFNIDGTGTHGLIALAYSPGVTADWGCTSTLSGASGTIVGTGMANTTAILNDITTNACTSAGPAFAFAPQICQYYDIPNWYLPSKDELSLLWTNRTTDITGTLDALLSTAIGVAPIWSSSEINQTQAWSLDGAGAMVNTGLKTDQNNVWPIRSF
jgi:hypothetical protein